MAFFDDKSKKLTWFTRNYFFLGTLLFVMLNILLFVCFGNSWEEIYGNVNNVWGKPFEFSNLLRAIFNTISHSDWEHVLFNMLFFAVAAIYIERKMGSITFIMFILGAMVFDASITTATDLALNWHGWSGIVYITQFYVFIDYCFSFQKAKRNKFNIIFGAIVCFISYASMAGDIKDGKLIVYGYPHGLVYNAGHYSAALAGIILALIIHLTQLRVSRQMQYVEIEKPTNSKAIKITYACIAIVMALLSCGTTLAALSADKRSDIMCSITFDSSVDTFDQKLEKDFATEKNRSYESIAREWLNTIPYIERKNYAYEFYFDQKYTQGFVKDYNTKNSCYRAPWGRGEFVPLKENKDKTIYVKTYEICYVQFEDYSLYINGDFPRSFEKENLYYDYVYTDRTIVEKNGTLRFQITSAKYSLDALALYLNGTEIVRDQEGYYKIENISEDIKITFELKS